MAKLKKNGVEPLPKKSKRAILEAIPIEDGEDRPRHPSGKTLDERRRHDPTREKE